MGLLICKCCRRSCQSNNRNSVGVLAEKHIKLLLLGIKGSGKTEIAHMLKRATRSNYESTNGSQYYQTQLTFEGGGGGGERQSLGITEIGGNDHMQRIWHHYFPATMGIIYCFDMSSSYELLRSTFQLLEKILSNDFIRGKSILLIGTKSDLVDEGLQLYDIENTFHLEAMAAKYACSLRMCYAGIYPKESDCSQSLNDGIKWLAGSVLCNFNELQTRIKSDTNLKAWQEQTQKLIMAGKMKRWSYRRFPYRKAKRRKLMKIWKYVGPNSYSLRIRPHTAPSVFAISYNSGHASSETMDTTVTVPNDLESASPAIAEPRSKSKSKQVTNV